MRDILNKTIFEFLYLYNHNTGEEIPWLATSYTIAADAKSVDVTLRNGVEWSDGQPFTADDVKFTLELLRDNPRWSSRQTSRSGSRTSPSPTPTTSRST